MYCVVLHILASCCYLVYTGKPARIAILNECKSLVSRKEFNYMCIVFVVELDYAAAFDDGMHMAHETEKTRSMQRRGMADAYVVVSCDCQNWRSGRSIIPPHTCRTLPLW